MADVELVLEHLGDFEQDERRGMLGDNVSSQDRLLGRYAPQVEVVDLVDNVELQADLISAGMRLTELSAL